MPNNWNPRAYQKKLWLYLQNGGRDADAVWHRRSGKDEVALHWTACAGHKRTGTYWHMLPEAAQARKAIWNAINPHTGLRRIDEAFPQEIRASMNDNEMFMKLKCGSTWQVVGSDNFNSLVGSPPIGIVLSEWALAKPQALAYLRPILAENNGWQMKITTPRGKNHAYQTFKASQQDPKAFAQILTVDDTGVLSPERIADEKASYIRSFGEAMGMSLFRQEYYCSFDVAIVGAIYGHWIEKAEQAGRVTKVPYDPARPVYTAWDLGYGDAVAIWFYQVGFNEIHIIDYHESNGHDVPYYADLVKDKPYKYSGHFLPQDAAHKVFAAGGRSVVEQFWKEGVKARVVTETTHLNRIAATRKALPLMWWDEEHCALGIERIRNYRYKWDEDRKVFSDEPFHDENSHGATALEIVSRIWQNPPQEIDKNLRQEPTAEELFFGPKRNELRNFADRLD